MLRRRWGICIRIQYYHHYSRMFVKSAIFRTVDELQLTPSFKITLSDWTLWTRIRSFFGKLFFQIKSLKKSTKILNSFIIFTFTNQSLTFPHCSLHVCTRKISFLWLKLESPSEDKGPCLWFTLWINLYRKWMWF